MMDFDLSEEHRILEQTVRDWGAREIAPRIRDLDRAHQFDRSILPRMAELGLLGCSVPVEYGGAGMDYLCARSRQRGARVRRHVAAGDHVRARGAQLPDAALVGHRRSEAAVPGAAGAGEEDRDLRADRARGGQRRARHPDGRREEGRSLFPHRREDVDLARRRRRQLPGLRVVGSREEEEARSRRAQRVHRRARVQGVLERDADDEVGHPRRQHRALQDGRRRSAGREPRRPRRRGLQDRDVRARSGALHRGGGRDRADSRVPRRQRRLRARPQDLRRRDRPAPAGQGNDRADGVGLSDVASAVAAFRLAQERRPAQHARDRTREVVLDGRLRARRRRRRPDPRRQRLLRRISGRALLPELQGRGHLRRHARDSQADAGGLRARVPRRQADALRAAAVWRQARESVDLSLELLRVVEAAAIASAQTMGRGDREGADQAAVQAMRKTLESVPIDGTIVIGEGERDEAPMLYIGEQVGQAARGETGSVGRWTSPSIRSRARTCARPARRTRSPCSRRRRAAACCTRPICTWRSSSSARARGTW